MWLCYSDPDLFSSQLEFPKLFCYILESGGAVAQLGERLTGSQKVVGSNPISSTSLIARRFTSSQLQKFTTELLEKFISSRPEGLSNTTSINQKSS
jgi:hypothetical protein